MDAARPPTRKPMPRLSKPLAAPFGRDTDFDFGDELAEHAREIESLLRGARHGAVANTQTLLIMAHDGADGEVALDGDQARVRWPGVGDKPVFKRVVDYVDKVVATWGGTSVPDPLWSKLFGKANIQAFLHLARIAHAGHVVSAEGSEDYLPHASRFRIPTLFFHGEHNRRFRPAGTTATRDMLAAVNGAHYYERQVISETGHIDCIFGRNAARDVFPLAVRHLLAS
jgi:hypothetical protein